MDAYLDTAGERMSIECPVAWVADLVEEGSGGQLHRPLAEAASVCVRVESERRPFETTGWELLTRGAWKRLGEVVIEDVCTSGFDLHVRCDADRAEFTYRWRPPARERVARWILRSRFHLIARAVLMQYPALWYAGARGRVPLHASAVVAGDSVVLVTAPSGVGRSTLLQEALETGGRSTGDNLAVGDGTTLWGLVEPLRLDIGAGRRMPHGRRETPIASRAVSLTPDCLVVLTRTSPDTPSVVDCSVETAARALVTSTYMAGELRRFWSFAATLSAGTGVGPAHPPIVDVASRFAGDLRCVSLSLGVGQGTRLAELVSHQEVIACA